jgi:hypothetical protein
MLGLLYDDMSETGSLSSDLINFLANCFGKHDDSLEPGISEVDTSILKDL